MTEALTTTDLEQEGATALPTKEVMSLLDLNANVDLGLDLAAPVDLAAAANLNVAAPIEASAAANVLSPGATAGAEAVQHGTLDQTLSGTAHANAPQTAGVSQSADPTAGSGTVDPAHPGDTTSTGTGSTSGTTAPATTGTSVPAPSGTTVNPAPTASGLLDGSSSLLDANVNIHADANVAAPIDGAVAANANVAAPVDAAVGANILSPDAHATALAPQELAIDQQLNGVDATATATQNATVTQ